MSKPRETLPSRVKDQVKPDRIITRYEDDLSRRSFENPKMVWSTYIDIFEIQRIGERLRVLATQIPPNLHEEPR
jgi:hypothetical protein